MDNKTYSELENRVSHLETRAAVTEKDLEHGAKAFSRLEAAIDKLSETISILAKQQNGLFIKIALWVVGGLSISLVGLIGYLYKLQVGV